MHPQSVFCQITIEYFKSFSTYVSWSLIISMDTPLAPNQIEMPKFTSSSIIKVQYPELGAIPQIQPTFVQVDSNYYPLESMEPARTETHLHKRTPDQRKDFLIHFYKTFLTQLLALTVISIFGTMRWFQWILIKNKKIFYHRNTTYDDYMSWYGPRNRENSNTYNYDHYYYERYQDYINDYYTRHQLRWTFYTSVAIFALSLLLSLICQRTGHKGRLSKVLFWLQTIFGGLVLVGSNGMERGYSGVTLTFALLGTLIALSIGSIVNVQKNYLQLNQRKCFQLCINILFGFQIIYALTHSYIRNEVIYSGLFFIYPVYYFLQLNESILDDPVDLSNQECKWFCSMIRYIRNGFRSNPDSQNAIQCVNKEYFMVHVELLKLLGTLIAVGSLIAFAILTRHGWIIALIILIQLLGQLFQTQVVPNNFKKYPVDSDDYVVRVNLIIWDFLFPFKNFKRGYYKSKIQNQVLPEAQPQATPIIQDQG